MKISIFQYTDYREYLKDFYREAKSLDKKFSFRFFARMAGFKSSSVFKEVMDGKINIADSSIEKYAIALKLNKEETLFFRNLVLFNQAKTSEKKQFYAEQLLKSRTYKKLHPLSVTQLNYFRNWYYIPVREMVALKGFREDPAWIAKKIVPSVTAQEVKKALEELLILGLLRRKEDGTLEQSTSNVSTGDEVISQTVAGYHREIILKAAEAIDRFPLAERNISTVAVGVSAQTLGIIKEMIQKFRKELLEAAGKTDEPNQVYHINFQVFPVTQRTEDEK